MRRVATALALARRTGYLLLLFGPLAALAPLTAWVPRGVGQWLDERWWGLFCSAVSAAGPTAIKLMQWAVARPDLFPPALVERLGHVHEMVGARMSYIFM